MSDAKDARRFSPEEREAMKERARESRRRAKMTPEEAEADVLAKIQEMEQPDRDVALRLHALIGEAAPGLSPKTWYGMPAYAKDGKIVCFFQGSKKFKTRYSTLGFSDEAKLDDGSFWPSAYALAELTPAVEERIRALVVQAVG